MSGSENKENSKPIKSIFKKPKEAPQRLVTTYTENEKAVKFTNVITECMTPFTAFYISKKLNEHKWFTSLDTTVRVAVSSQILSLFEMSNGYVLDEEGRVTNVVWRTGCLPMRFLLLPGVVGMSANEMDDLMRAVFVLSLKMLDDQSYRDYLPLDTQMARSVLYSNLDIMKSTFQLTVFEKGIVDASADYQLHLLGKSSRRAAIIDDFISTFWKTSSSMDARLNALEEYLTVLMVNIADGGVFLHFPNQLMWMLTHYMESADHPDADKLDLRAKLYASVFLKEYCIRLLHTIEERYNDLIAGHLNGIAVRFIFTYLSEMQRFHPEWNAELLENARHFCKHKELLRANSAPSEKEKDVKK